MTEHRRLLVADVAALGWDLVREAPAARAFGFRPAETVFPALTCTVQASFRTAAHPCFHDMPANGIYDRRLARPFFWEQSARLVYGRRIWDGLRERGGRVGLLFWQQSLGESADLVLSPRPVHKHHGGLIADCLSRPADLYARLCGELGRPFGLASYWGPFASHRSTEWIAGATSRLLCDRGAPDLLLTYLPHLDYDLQRHGPASPAAGAALDRVLGWLSELRKTAAAQGWDWLFFGDYAMAPVTRPPVFPNRRLREAGLLQTRAVRGRLYPDFFHSDALALADHEIALVYARDEAAADRARRALEGCDGIAAVLDAEGQRIAATDEEGGPDLVLVAAEGAWFAYPWWDRPREAPDYARHIDIHNKPGYDPCELFAGFPPTRITDDPGRVRGTHGRAGPGRRIAWASSLAFDPAPDNLLDLSRAVSRHLESVR